jgi:hypothetical protein
MRLDKREVFMEHVKMWLSHARALNVSLRHALLTSALRFATGDDFLTVFKKIVAKVDAEHDCGECEHCTPEVCHYQSDVHYAELLACDYLTAMAQEYGIQPCCGGKHPDGPCPITILGDAEMRLARIVGMASDDGPCEGCEDCDCEEEDPPLAN